MKSKEVEKLTLDEVKNKINSLKKDLFNIRFKKVNGQLVDTSKVSQIKNYLAKEYKRFNNQIIELDKTLNIENEKMPKKNKLMRENSVNRGFSTK